MRKLCHVLFLAIPLAGCTPALDPASFANTTPEMRPEAFFAGVTRSTGLQEDRSGAPVRRFHVESIGTAQPDGNFRLDQTITFEGDAPLTRSWLLHRVDGHHYAGTLTDASGPVAAEAYGNLFHLIYPMKSPSLGRMEQWIYLQPDGRTVLNEATVTILGITAARISERISRARP